VRRPNDDVDGDGVGYTFNLRFAGQYFDQETGLHYNYFRTYDPSTGRYITTDPIGLVGGLNTYSYAENNPLYWADPLGLCPMCIPFIPPAIEAIGYAAGSLAIGLGLATGIEAGINAYNENVSDDDSAEGANCPTDHAKGRSEEAKTDRDRQVGDPNKVTERGRKFLDTESGNTVHVDGDRVVVTDSSGRRITQFKNPRKNTQDRIRRGRWTPL